MFLTSVFFSLKINRKIALVHLFPCLALLHGTQHPLTWYMYFLKFFWSVFLIRM